MQEEALTTGVDDLVNILKGKGKIALKDAAKQLHIPESTVQLWVDFLVEERVLGIEYRFTKAYIFLNQDVGKKAATEQTFDLKHFKEEFFAHAREKQLPEAKIQELWTAHLRDTITKLQPYFIQEVQKRRLQKPLLLLEAYKKRLTMM